ncbi:MAG: helix-turn-helix domain-containing protein [Saprospiraceae bacterium]|nr:helix-turn-helix domain-containing protein [Saprospiraceae bacterium]
MIELNLKYLRGKHNISQAELAEGLGIPRTTLSAYERGFVEPNIDLMLRMSKYFKVSIDDLIAYNLEHRKAEHPDSDNLRVLAISVDPYQNSNIELVDTRAEAGYLDGMADPEYIKELPKIYFPKIPQGTYRGFEIRGDSMLPIEPGSIVLSSYIEKLNEVKDGKTYIVISKSEGVVYKRVKNLPKEKTLLLISDNEAYHPYPIHYGEIAEIWQYYAHLSFSDTKHTFNAMLEDKLSDIQRKVSTIHSRILGS